MRLAILENNLVVNIVKVADNYIVSNNEIIDNKINKAHIGFTYDSDRDVFIPPKPFESWVLDEETCLWTAPVPMPEPELNADGNLMAWYVWDESAGKWVVSES